MSSVAPLPGPVYQDISVISAKTKGDTESSIPHKHRSDPDGKETAISKDTAVRTLTIIIKHMQSAKPSACHKTLLKC